MRTNLETIKKIMKIIIIVLSFLIATTNIYSQTLTDSTICQIAFWEIGDTVDYAFTSIEEKLEEGKETIETTTYNMRMTVLDSTAESYQIRWDYSDMQMDYIMDEIERELVKLSAKIPTYYRTDEFGTFESLENWEDMIGIVDTVFSKFIAEQGKDLPDSVNVMMKNMMMGMFQSEEQANYWAQDINQFHYLYGANLSRTVPYEGQKLYTNPFVKTMMPGTQKISVVAIDEENSIAHIKVESGITGEATRQLMYDFIANNLESFNLTKEELKMEDIPAFTVSEELNCIYHIDSGYILRGNFTKLTTLNDDYKRRTMEYEMK